MLGESRWKVLVLIAGLLLAQAIDSPGRGSLQLKDVGQLRRSYIPNHPSQWLRYSRSSRDITALSADLAQTGVAGFPEYNAAGRRSRIDVRDELFGEDSRYYDDYSLSDKINDSYNVGPKRFDNFNDGHSASNNNNARNNVAFEDNVDYDTTAPEDSIALTEEENLRSKGLYAEAFDRQPVTFPPSGRLASQQFQEKFIANQRYSDYSLEIPRKPRGPTNVGFPISKSRYPFYNPYYSPPNPDYDNYYGNPYQNPIEFNPLVKNGFFAPGFASKSPSAQPFWKTRTPRVVFPNGNDNGPLVQSNSHQGGTGNVLANAINYNNDNVVFRDQNFGINELAAIQEIRNDFNLQDIAVGGNEDNSIKDKEIPGPQTHHSTDDKQNNRRGKSITIDNSEEKVNPDNQYIDLDHQNNKESFLVIKKITIDFVNNTENDMKTVEKPIIEITDKNVSIVANNVINPKIDQNGPVTEYVPPRGSYILPNTNLNNRIPNSIRIPNEIQRKPIPGNRTPKTLQYLLPYLTNNKNNEAGKAAPYLAPNPPFEKENKDFNGKKRDDGQKCNQGGTCEFFLYCWMSGGLLDGSCGLLRGCCHKLAKAASLGVQDSNVLDNLLGSDPGEPLEYGPVVNDNSKSYCC